MAALSAPAKADVAVMSKVYPTRSHSGAAQGGFNAVMGREDSVEAHVYDTVKGSDYLGDQDAIEVLCAEGPEVIRELERLGVPWTRRPDGHVAQRALGGAGFPRACFAADFSGHVVLHTLYEKALEQGVRFYSEWCLLDLLVEEGRIAGALAFELSSGRLETFRARVVILATGGYGRVYAKTTNSLAGTGDGMAAAYRAGAALCDLEFVQFHPTTLYGTNILISEAARGEGGVLHNSRGERFMEKYAPQKKELASRDVVARGIFQEIKEGRGVAGNYVNLDLTHLGEEKIKDRLPQVLELAGRYAGVDAAREPIPIEPAQHYSMGGIRTDIHCETTLPGLLACGEAACVSVHGANRLGGNSLLETVVYGRIAGRRAAELAKGADLPPAPGSSLEKALDRWNSVFGQSQPRHEGDSIFSVRREAAEMMTSRVGVFRVEEELRTAVESLDLLEERYRLLKVPPGRRAFNYLLEEHLETGNLLELSRLTARAALRRTESRGAHHRLDHPARNDRDWLNHTLVYKGKDGPVFKAGAVGVTKYQPEARGY